MPWPPGSATGLGALPDTDPVEATRVVLGELPELPHLPELPERGAGSDPVGRTAALLVDLHVDVLAGRWRLVDRPASEERRARDLLARDLDALEEVAEPHRGPLKLQVVGPWTLAGSLELPRGEKALSDLGATRDLAASLAEGVALHVNEVGRRLPGVSRLVVQVDEPLLPAVLTGRLPTASGWGRLPAVEEQVAETALAQVLAAAGEDAGVRCGGAAPPLGLLRRAGSRFVGLDGSALETVAHDQLGEAVEEGMGLLLGLVPAPPSRDEARSLALPARRYWQVLGLPPDRLAQAVVVTPASGLADLGGEEVLAVLRRCREVASVLQEPDDGSPG